MSNIPEDKPALTATLKEVKNYLREHYHKGVECPACSGFVRLYKRSFNASMAYALLLMYRHRIVQSMDFVHVENLLKRVAVSKNLRGDFHKAVHWSLLEAKKETHTNGSKRNGYYRLSPDGIKFVEGELSIPSHILIYNGKVQGFSAKKVFFKDVMKTKFDFVELMKEAV